MEVFGLCLVPPSIVNEKEILEYAQKRCDEATAETLPNPYVNRQSSLSVALIDLGQDPSKLTKAEKRQLIQLNPTRYTLDGKVGVGRITHKCAVRKATKASVGGVFTGLITVPGDTPTNVVPAYLVKNVVPCILIMPDGSWLVQSDYSYKANQNVNKFKQRIIDALKEYGNHNAVILHLDVPHDGNLVINLYGII